MKKVFPLFFVSLCFGIIAVVLWAGPAWAQPPGCSPVANNLAMCEDNLDACDADLAECEEDGGQTCPGDGYADPSFGTIGHGPALSYMDNGDGTFTDNVTEFMWEMKLKADGSDGGNCNATLQADRDVHCVNNSYTWSSTGTEADGTLFTVFLAELNGSAFAGFDDWCIPNVKRLQSILDYSINSIISPASSVPGETAASFYWSSTTSAFNTFNAWSVGFFSGDVALGNKKDLISRARAVRPCP